MSAVLDFSTGPQPASIVAIRCILCSVQVAAGRRDPSRSPASRPGLFRSYRLRYSSSSRRAIALARCAASASPSAAETIEPFIRMCHERANESVSRMPASPARRRTIDRMFSRYWTLAVADRVVRAHLQHDVDERARLEVVASKPAVEGVEDGEQLLLRGRPTACGLCFDPAKGPVLLALFEEGQHQVVLRGEVPVEGRLGHAGPLDHLVDTHSSYTATREKLIGGVKNALASIRLDGPLRIEGRCHVRSVAIDRPVFPC